MAAVYRARPGARVVVRAGRTVRRLEIDGTFASWWRPGRCATGSVWDALAVPLLALPVRRRRAVLLLGLGGGSAARLLRRLAPSARIVGVEIDREVVRAARRWFGLDALGVEVVRADALQFLARERRRFDLILDDVFVGTGEAVAKPAWLPEPGLALAALRLARGGLLATNQLDRVGLAARALARVTRSQVEIRIAGFDNRVLVGGPDLDARRLRAAASRTPELAPALRRLSFRTLGPAEAPP
jgi:spermidine synthase